LIFHAYLLSFLHADLYDWYQAKLTSALLSILIIELSGNLRLQYDRIKEANKQLDKMVAERTATLHEFTEKLLENSENHKIEHSQKLHDGIGQQLTGIQLLCASLADQLLYESNIVASHAEFMKNQAARVHQQIRKISRLLFPVRIGQVGLVPALDELSAHLSEIKPISIQIGKIVLKDQVPEKTTLQLYRICQETTLYALNTLGATEVCIDLEESPSDFFIRIRHNGAAVSPTHIQGPFALVQYRMNQLGGTVTNRRIEKRQQQSEFTIPIQPSSTEGMAV
jgi:signal transduction histidine kinase